MPAEKSCQRRLQNRYEEMWLSAIGKIRAGKIESDEVLAGGLEDNRRGLTLIARPSAGVRKSAAAFLRELGHLEPDQYYYGPADFHITVLSLFTATVESELFFAQTRQYLSAVDQALRKALPFTVEFAGVTVSPGAVLIQGFLENEGLNKLRDKLRRELRLHGLTEGLDARYRLKTAHMTVVRFRAPLRDSEQFASTLEHSRSRLFGTASIRSLSLVKNDWYMSHRGLQTLKRYRLT